MPHLRNSDGQDAIHEREVLEEMLKSEGWAVFVRRLFKEWRGDGYHARMGTALASSDPTAPKVVHATSIEVERMCQWPLDRIKHLRGSVE